MPVVIEHLDAPDSGNFELDVHLTASIRISRVRARQLVGIYLGNEVSTLFHGVLPDVLAIQGHKIFWRVPVVFSQGRKGQLGVIGHIDVDAETGTLSIAGRPIDDTHIDEMKAHARRLAASAALHATN